MVEIRLLGRFEVLMDRQPVPSGVFGGRLARSLLAILATRRGELVPKEVLAELLWPQRAPADPLGNLDVLASRARRALGDPSLLTASSGGMTLAGDDRIGIDAERFTGAVERGGAYLAAEQPGAALAAFREALEQWAEPLPDATYASWSEPFRRQLAELRLRAAEGGARAGLTLGNANAAVACARIAADAEPLREIANLLLVSALDLEGDQVGALSAFDRYRVALRDELGLDPSSEAYAIQERILRGVRAAADGSWGVLVAEGTPPDPRAAFGRRGSGPMRARTLASMALFAAGSDDYGRAGELVELAITEAGDDLRARAEALYAASIVDMNLGEIERSTHRADEALGYFELLGDDQGVANILDGKAMATFLRGRIAAGVEAFDRVARLFTDSGDLARVVTPRSTKGHGLVFMARPDDALVEIDDASRLAASLGDREGEAYTRWHRSEALAALGRSEEAIGCAREAVEIAEAIAHREWAAAAYRGLGIAYRSAGSLDEAIAAHTSGVEIGEGIALFETWNAACLARVLIEAGRHEEARSWVARACAGGPPLGLFEARLAEVLLAWVDGDARGETLAATLRTDALDAGHQAVADDLARLAVRG